MVVILVFEDEVAVLGLELRELVVVDGGEDLGGSVEVVHEGGEGGEHRGEGILHANIRLLEKV